MPNFEKCLKFLLKNFKTILVPDELSVKDSCQTADCRIRALLWANGAFLEKQIFLRSQKRLSKKWRRDLPRQGAKLQKPSFKYMAYYAF